MTLIRVKARTLGVVGYISCMRGSWLGNPFPLNRYSLDDSLRLFKEYFQWRFKNDIIFYKYLHELLKRSNDGGEITLGCTCKLTTPCHVDIIIDEIERLKRLEEIKYFNRNGS